MTTATATAQVGDKVRNKISGAEGIVVIRQEYLAGYTHLRVQKEGSTNLFDIARDTSDEVEWRVIEDEGYKRPPEPEVAANRFELGQRVKDIITGFTGIVNARCEHINRCWTYDVQSEMVKKETGEPGPCEAFSSQRLVLVNDGLYVNPNAPAKKGKKEARVPARVSGSTPYTPSKGW